MIIKRNQIQFGNSIGGLGNMIQFLLSLSEFAIKKKKNMLIYLSFIMYYNVILLWKTTENLLSISSINQEIIISWTETFVKSAMTFNESEKVTLLIGSHGINVMRWCLAITRCVCLPSSSCVHGLKLSFGRRRCAGGQTENMAGLAARRRLLRWEQHLIRLHLTPWLQALLKPTQLHSSP